MKGKQVLITGASAGIGAACAWRFAEVDAGLVLWARRAERLAGLAEDIARHHGVPVRTAALDVRDREAVFREAAALAADGVAPDVLINSAGLARGFATVQEGDPADWDEMVDTNVKGLLYVTRAVLPLMIERGRGHVINLGSTAGRQVYPKGNVYAATKYAVRALTEAIGVDLVGTPIRVSSVDPGFVETEFSLVRFRGDAERARQVYRGFRPLSADDVADAVFYVASVPERINVRELVLMPTAQRNSYVLHRAEPRENSGR